METAYLNLENPTIETIEKENLSHDLRYHDNVSVYSVYVMDFSDHKEVFATVHVKGKAVYGHVIKDIVALGFQLNSVKKMKGNAYSVLFIKEI